MVLAQSLLLNGELEAAVTTAGQAVEEGDALQSARFQRYVTDFQREVSTHAMKSGGAAVQRARTPRLGPAGRRVASPGVPVARSVVVPE
jgi:hypothetical protein